VNGKGASKMHINLGADVVVNAEGNTEMLAMVRAQCPSGVCAAGMLKTVQYWNLGDPVAPRLGKRYRSSTQDVSDGQQEVGWARTTEEVG